jgi:16S rRNA (guanine527-N7)-methyltransferase
MELITKYFTEFDEVQTAQYTGLQALYEDWNSKINVISRKDMENFYLHHVLHSLVIATQFNFVDGLRVMDLGCGGGFPGVPLAIFFPNVEFVLVDSIAKKLKVVNEVCEALNIKNVTTIHSRAEDLKNEPFDAVVSRAVAPLGNLWHWSKKHIRRAKRLEQGQPNGLICLKGGDLTQEIFESQCKPRIWEIEKIFNESFYKEKFMLYVPL